MGIGLTAWKIRPATERKFSHLTDKKLFPTTDRENVKELRLEEVGIQGNGVRL